MSQIKFCGFGSCPAISALHAWAQSLAARAPQSAGGMILEIMSAGICLTRVSGANQALKGQLIMANNSP